MTSAFLALAEQLFATGPCCTLQGKVRQMHKCNTPIKQKTRSTRKQQDTVSERASERAMMGKHRHFLEPTFPFLRFLCCFFWGEYLICLGKGSRLCSQNGLMVEGAFVQACHVCTNQSNEIDVRTHTNTHTRTHEPKPPPPKTENIHPTCCSG